MTFAQLKTKLLGTDTEPGDAFPLGTPENLRRQCETFILEGLIEIQRYIPCWQVGHTDVYPACDVMVQNHASVITKPEGQIVRVYTIETDVDITSAPGGQASGWDRPVIYQPRELRELRRWMSRYRVSLVGRNQPFTMVAVSEGFRMPNTADNSVLGRSLSGAWSIDARTNRIIVAPWIQSNEAIVVEWNGIKRVWNNSDLVSDNPDFTRLVKLWLLQEYGRHWASADIQVRVSTWDNAQADAIVHCHENSQTPRDGGTDDESVESSAYYRTAVPDVPDVASDLVRICFVGDTGAAGVDAASVAAAVIAKDLDMVVIVGDTVYSPVTVAAALAPYSPLIALNRLVVALGNHDLDLNDGADVLAAVKNPGNGRYFSVVSGNVEVFVINSGIRTDGVVVEPNGNFSGSIQSTEVKNMISRSLARWKLAVLHHPPYTSGTRYSPGISAIRWASDLEVHTVISGHSHNYERGTWRGRKHVVVGTGGRTLDTFTTPPIDGSEVRESRFGFLMLEATKDAADFSFIGVDGATYDEFKAAGDPATVSMDPIEVPTLMTEIFNDIIEAGTDYLLDVFMKESDGSPTDMTGATSIIQLRRSIGAALSLELTSAVGAITITPLEGKMHVRISPAQTKALANGIYVYAMEVTFPGPLIERPIEGIFTVTPEIVLP